jgi:hypothetical protein
VAGRSGQTIELEASGVLLDNPFAFATYVRALLTATVMANVLTLVADPTIPLLYNSGCRFIREPRGKETFVDLHKVREKKGGDCAHLCAWRVAELRARYQVPATLRVEWQIDEARKLRIFHVLVRRPDLMFAQLPMGSRVFKRDPRGVLECPSAALGMYSVSDSVAA